MGKKKFNFDEEKVRFDEEAFRFFGVFSYDKFQDAVLEQSEVINCSICGEEGKIEEMHFNTGDPVCPKCR